MLTQSNKLFLIISYWLLTFGRASKSGPIQSKTNSKNKQENKLVSCVFPPTISWTKLLDNDTATGAQLKKLPQILLDPWQFMKYHAKQHEKLPYLCETKWITFVSAYLCNKFLVRVDRVMISFCKYFCHWNWYCVRHKSNYSPVGKYVRNQFKRRQSWSWQPIKISCYLKLWNR